MARKKLSTQQMQDKKNAQKRARTALVTPGEGPEVPDGAVSSLADKATLVRMKKSTFSTSRTDQEETDRYGAGTVKKHLFAGSDNLVKQTTGAFNDAYTYMREHTAPWDTGQTIVNNHFYNEFTEELALRINTAYEWLAHLEENWYDEVDKDIDRLAQIASEKGKPWIATTRSDYPAKSELRRVYSISVEYSPIPREEDFRVAITDADRRAFRRHMDRAAKDTTAHVLRQMLIPLQDAVKRLRIPIGEKGSVFRNTLIENIADAAARMEVINMSGDPQIGQAITDVQEMISEYEADIETLRKHPMSRRKAVQDMEAMVDKVGGLLGEPLLNDEEQNEQEAAHG